MPQLNPAPWFFTLLFSWAVLLSMLPPKFLCLFFPNEPTQLNLEKAKTNPLNWLWQ